MSNTIDIHTFQAWGGNTSFCGWDTTIWTPAQLIDHLADRPDDQDDLTALLAHFDTSIADAMDALAQ